LKPQARGFNDFWGWIGANFDRSVAWKEIDWVRESWDGPIVLKGVLDVEDARDAVRAGADGVVVSNHGGRQLDGVKSSIAALPRIADAVGGDLTVLMDGGIRSGLDILKALALGAKGVLIGRAWAFALGAGGQPMIERMLGTLRAELATAMILTGCTDVGRADKTLLDEAS
jgi:L-lactate dehydrogenase (cytochrome)